MTALIPQDAFIHPKAVIGKDVIIEHGARIYEGCNIGDGSIIGANAVLRPYTVIGKKSIFGTLSCSEGDCIIGDDSTVHAQCHITKGVTIGNCVFIAPYFIATNTPQITPGKHGRNPAPDLKTLPTVIEDGVRIGANVRMTPGHKIGAYAVIDQDCLITRDVPAFAHIRAEGKSHVGRIMI